MLDTVATDDFLVELARVVDTIAILSPTSFALAGGPAINIGLRSPAGTWGTPLGGGVSWQGPSAAEDPLTRAVQDALYDRRYSRRLDEGWSQATTPVDDPDFAESLARANASRERWEPGWVIQQLAPNGAVYVHKGERERIAMPGAFISAIGPGMTPQPGSAALVRVPAGALDVQPGFYFAFGETLDELADQLSLVRFYFHCAADAAVDLVRSLTRGLNRFQLPFQLKLPSSPMLYGRADAAVLYVGMRYASITLRIVDAARADLSLGASVPLFAKPLWPGIAGAADPGNGESFGVHRCRLVAEGIVDAWRDGRQDGAARLEAVAARFAAVGLDLRRPWLGPNSIDAFQMAEQVGAI
jgi:hypothetical protein